MKKDNLTVVLVKFAKELNLYIDPRKVYDELLIHPDYPSLLAISDVLLYMGIENGAYRVNIEKLEEVPCPFIAHTGHKSGDFMLIDKVNADHITVTNHKMNRYKMDRREFAMKFDGVVLTADKVRVKASTLKQLTSSAIKIQLVSAAFLLGFLAAVFTHTPWLHNFNWHLLMLSLLKTAGLTVSILLLIQSFDSNNPLVQRLCQAGGKNNCKDILSSKAARAFKWLSWSELGFFYFSSTWLFMFMGGASAGAMQVLAILTLLCLPYTFYSIYYQARVARQWCVLCCSVQAIFWLEFISTGSLLHFPLAGISPADISTLAISFILPAGGWILLKPLLLDMQQMHPIKVQLQQFKYNAEQFERTLAGQPKYSQPSEEWSIVLGNNEAENVITMVSNPYCPPCAKMHKALHELLEQRPDMQARIIFTATNTDDDVKTPVSRHMMTLNGLADKSIVKQALYDWYEQKQKNYEAWAKAYPVSFNEHEFNKINQQKSWCEVAEVSATPTMLLNGYKLPENYQLGDLKYMLQ